MARRTVLTQVARLAAADAPLRYPETKRIDHIDDYHGTKVADPYRWLEDADSPESRAWIDAEKELTERFFAAIPARESIRERLTAVWDYERFGLPRRVGSAMPPPSSVMLASPMLPAPSPCSIDAPPVNTSLVAPRTPTSWVPLCRRSMPVR